MISLIPLFRKFAHHLSEDGVAGTAGAVADRVRRSVSNTLEGTPCYYAGQRIRFKRRYDEAAITPVWVSPAAITGLTGEYEIRDDSHLDYVPHFKPREARWETLPYEQEVAYGTVLDGDWDMSEHNFSKLLLYQGTRQHYVEGVDWQETVYYTELVEQFHDQGWEHEEAETLATERCEKIEGVYERINRDGYRSQRELNGHPLHEVTVTVGRNGQLLYNCEGRHRLSVAKVLGIDAIPVLLLVRHKEFDGTVEIGGSRRTL